MSNAPWPERWAVRLGICHWELVIHWSLRHWSLVIGHSNSMQLKQLIAALPSAAAEGSLERELGLGHWDLVIHWSLRHWSFVILIPCN